MVAFTALILVIVGTLEARESARQLTEAAGAPRLQAAGAGLTAVGLLASTVVYLGLGWWAGADRAALRLGALTGVVAGLVGGAVRAWLIAGALGDLVERYATLPGWFVPAALATYVALAGIASAAGGAAIAFAGVRIRRTRARRA